MNYRIMKNLKGKYDLYDNLSTHSKPIATGFNSKKKCKIFIKNNLELNHKIQELLFLNEIVYEEEKEKFEITKIKKPGILCIPMEEKRDIKMEIIELLNTIDDKDITVKIEIFQDIINNMVETGENKIQDYIKKYSEER